jgi:DNA-binding transcriptional ArsR family regulator
VSGFSRTSEVRLKADTTIPCRRKKPIVLDVQPRAVVYNRLVMNRHADRLDATFAALADPTRRAILARLALSEASVRELTGPFQMSQPAISKHLKVLERAGLVSYGREAQKRPRRLEAKPLAEANEWLERYRRYWEQNFQRLDAVLEELKTQGGRRSPKRTKRRQ